MLPTPQTPVEVTVAECGLAVRHQGPRSRATFQLSTREPHRCFAPVARPGGLLTAGATIRVAGLIPRGWVMARPQAGCSAEGTADGRRDLSKRRAWKARGL
jgi:hypothetical protein